MNVLIVDTNKIDLDTVQKVFDACADKTMDDVLVIPKGIDILQDISVDWMKMIRDRLDEKIKALENNTK
jgi:hypothetical protein